MRVGDHWTALFALVLGTRPYSFRASCRRSGVSLYGQRTKDT
ncbi:hypothetical protein B005_5495 [Nocardiopsis alba ATCC BAA-2165]|uniref:Uncharacterized protein n=1 Tax=Nocardiopsis alba (strain ATCC BAA-2165 / BE74) TaxID=1205910 RepID=J7LHT2_NOCAA|nr:hypothetical protein B005_5495 [Nocardiopsis alba ATCC BAA-2165]